jgi:hypothetical protein
MDGMLNRALRAPSTLALVGLSMEQAECLLAAIWCVLEAHALPSPAMDVRSAAGSVDISLTFGSAEDCSIVSACWRSARRTSRQARLPSHRECAINLVPHQMPTGTVPAPVTVNGAEPTPTEPQAVSQPLASEVVPILPGRIDTSPGESCPSSMPLPDRASRGCRFITGDPRDFYVLGEAIYCGSPVERIGEPWCAEHRKICYTPSKQTSTMHSGA